MQIPAEQIATRVADVVDARYADMHTRGLAKFYSGSSQLFHGFARCEKSLRRHIVLASVLATQHNARWQTIREQLQPFEKNFNLFISGVPDTHPAYAPIAYAEGGLEAMDLIRIFLDLNTHLIPPSLSFNRCVLDASGGSITLGSTSVHNSFCDLTEVFDRYTTEKSGVPIHLDCQQLTLCRLRTMSSVGKRQEFVNTIERIDYELRQSPLLIRTEVVVATTVWNLLKQYRNSF